MSAARPKRSRAEAENAPTENPPVASGSTEGTTPYLLDFLPRESEADSRLSQFFARLREGRLSTRRCRADGSLSWPPRLVCPKCHRSDLEWVDLPETGTMIFTADAVYMGASYGPPERIFYRSR